MLMQRKLEVKLCSYMHAANATVLDAVSMLGMEFKQGAKEEAAIKRHLGDDHWPVCTQTWRRGRHEVLAQLLSGWRMCFSTAVRLCCPLWVLKGGTSTLTRASGRLPASPSSTEGMTWRPQRFRASSHSNDGSALSEEWQPFAQSGVRAKCRSVLSNKQTDWRWEKVC